MNDKLTIGIATYEDYDGLFFTIQSLRMHHADAMKDVEFIVIDNNPDSACGEASRNFLKSIKEPAKYIPFTEYKSPFLKGQIFHFAETKYVLVMDSHILMIPNSIKKLIEFFRQDRDEGNLLHGPLVYDDLDNVSTHFENVWRGQMWGIWATDERSKNENNPPFEIEMQGMGLFACRKFSWPKFNPNFRGFGGEEGYIHRKFKAAGKKTLCLPFLRWMHRFNRPNGVPYPLALKDRIMNYFIGHIELGLDCTPIFDHFKQFESEDNLKKMHQDASKMLQNDFLKFNF